MVNICGYVFFLHTGKFEFGSNEISFLFFTYVEYNGKVRYDSAVWVRADTYLGLKEVNTLLAAADSDFFLWTRIGLMKESSKESKSLSY